MEGLIDCEVVIYRQKEVFSLHFEEKKLHYVCASTQLVLLVNLVQVQHYSLYYRLYGDYTH